MLAGDASVRHGGGSTRGNGYGDVVVGNGHRDHRQGTSVRYTTVLSPLYRCTTVLSPLYRSITRNHHCTGPLPVATTVPLPL